MKLVFVGSGQPEALNLETAPHELMIPVKDVSVIGGERNYRNEVMDFITGDEEDLPDWVGQRYCECAEAIDTFFDAHPKAKSWGVIPMMRTPGWNSYFLLTQDDSYAG